MCKRSHALCDIKSLMHTVSPLLHIAVFNSQLASEDHGASRGSRVSGKSVRQVGIRVESWSQTRGKRLLSEITARSLGRETRADARFVCERLGFDRMRER